MGGGECTAELGLPGVHMVRMKKRTEGSFWPPDSHSVGRGLLWIAIAALLTTPRGALAEPQELWHIVFNLDVEKAREILATQPDFLTRTGPDGRTALHCAAENPDLLRLFIDGGALVNAVDNQGSTPLHHACLQANTARHLQAVRNLVQAGANLGIVNMEGHMPFCSLVGQWDPSDEQKALVSECLSLPALAVNGVEGQNRTLLHEAAAQGTPEAIQLLLARGWSPLAPTDTGATPLHVAATSNNVTNLKLLATVTPVDTVDAKGRGALDLVMAMDGRREAGLALVELGADLLVPFTTTLRDPCGNRAPSVTRFQWFASITTGKLRDDFVALIRTSPTIKLTCRAADGKTLLHGAAEWWSPPVVNALLERGVDPTLTTTDGRTPLHFAVTRETHDPDKLAATLEVVRALATKNLTNRVDRDGNTPLHLADEHDKLELIEALKERGANPDLTNNQGRPALLPRRKD